MIYIGSEVHKPSAVHGFVQEAGVGGLWVVIGGNGHQRATEPGRCLVLAYPSPEVEFDLGVVDQPWSCLVKRAGLQVSFDSWV